jgi:hypothetical protein
MSGNIVEANSREDTMEAAIIHSNEKKLRQAHATPFMQPPLAEEVGWLGTGPSAKTILDGIFEIPNQTKQMDTQHN